MKKTLLFLLCLVVFAFVKTNPVFAYGGTPYGGTARTIPGKIQVEDFDEGGEGVAYHDDDASNLGGFYRPNEGPDINPEDGDYAIGWFKDGEWLNYTVDVQAGVYDLNVRTGTPLDGTALLVYLDDSLIADIDIPNNGDWEPMVTTTVSITIPKGGNGRVLRLENINNDYDFSWVEFVKTADINTLSKSVDKVDVGFYPSPVKNYMTLTNLNPQSIISVYSMVGTKVAEAQNGVSRELKLGMSSVLSGVYIVRVENLNRSKVQSFKVVKQ